MPIRKIFEILKHSALIFSGEKSFAGNSVLSNPWLNQRCLHVYRKQWAHNACQFRRWLMTLSTSHGCSSEITSKFDANGFVLLPNFLPQESFAALRAEVAGLQQRAIEMVQTPATTRRFNLDLNNTAHLPALNQLLNNPLLLGALQYAAGYRGSPIIAVQCICTDADGPESGHDPQTEWHADTFHSTAKAWLFLHDVALDDGPFAYVPASHALTAKRLAWEQVQSETAATHPNVLHARGSFRASEGELSAMGYGEPVVGVVPGNTLVVADTSGFHRRTPSPGPTVRVEIYLSLRRNPFFAGLYPSLLGLPLIKRWWATWAFNIYEWQTRRGKTAWHPSATQGLTEVEKNLLR